MIEPKRLAFLLEGKLKKALEEGHTSTPSDPSRLLDLRPSSFPYCGLRSFLNLPKSMMSTRSLPYSGSAYVRIGSAVHQAIQDSLSFAESIQVVRNWSCQNCGHVREFQLKPEECVRCAGTLFTYRELRLVEDDVTGNCDDVYLIRHQGRDLYIPVDYKTTRHEKFESKKANPEVGYVQQLGTYLRIAKRRYPKLDFPLAALVYIDRAIPTRFCIATVPEVSDELLARYKKMHRQFLKVASLDDAQSLHQPCSADTKPKEHEWCVYRSVCTAQERQGLDHMIQTAYVKVAPHLPLISESK